MTLYPQTTYILALSCNLEYQKNTTRLINQSVFLNETVIEPQDEERIFRHRDRSSDHAAKPSTFDTNCNRPCTKTSADQKLCCTSLERRVFKPWKQRLPTK